MFIFEWQHIISEGRVMGGGGGSGSKGKKVEKGQQRENKKELWNEGQAQFIFD